MGIEPKRIACKPRPDPNASPPGEMSKETPPAIVDSLTSRNANLHTLAAVHIRRFGRLPSPQR
jgi:hypothetical protein